MTAHYGKPLVVVEEIALVSINVSTIEKIEKQVIKATQIQLQLIEISQIVPSQIIELSVPNCTHFQMMGCVLVLFQCQ